ncbi:MAG TPA: molybdopterin cofactor-binding domain-containing protein [Hyphomicrobiaceae bacterium]|nr:molybdopterin cofactor-binding domain-containing protein [Hyphomicrobiaceae bacterium]
MTAVNPTLSRRALLGSGAALVVSFSLLRSPVSTVLAQAPPRLPGSLRRSPKLDAWLRVDANGITVFTGKAELGQGIKTALLQVAAEELGVEPSQIEFITADTAKTPNEGYTSGSQSMQDSATAIRHAAAQARELLIAAAAQRWGVPAEQLTVKAGTITAPDGRSASYGELASADMLNVEAQPQSKLTEPRAYRLIGKPLARVDIPAKVTGAPAYVQDLRPPGMVHARVVRPPSYAARLRSVDSSAVEAMPGVLKVVRDGQFLAVVADREYQAVQAMTALAKASVWDETKSLPDPAGIYDWVLKASAKEYVIHDARNGEAATGGRTLEAVYHRPYQLHGSIGPSCAVAQAEGDGLTVWTHGQGVYPLRAALAEMLHLSPDKVRCVHVEGSGCYGHNGADDAAADAALIAMALPGRPVRVQWMRDQEHAWEPFGAAMVTRARASLDGSGTVTDWHYEVWSNAHSTRPGGAGNLMPAWHLATPFAQPAPEPIPQPTGGGDRNAIPLYQFANTRVVHRFIADMPLRVSALRGLGAYMNVFSLESFMDELARAAGADPVEFRLRHLKDERARAVVQLAAEKFGWSAGRLAKGRGRGFAFAKYKNLAAYTAVAAELEVEHETGKIRLLRFVAADDSGEIVNPDGVRNQIEGGIIQSASWTLREAVAFDETRITSRDWSTYPILRFAELPDHVDVHLIDRPGQPFLGTGESAQGPTAAAIGNAVADAVGARIRELPLTPRRVKAAIGI